MPIPDFTPLCLGYMDNPPHICVDFKGRHYAKYERSEIRFDHLRARLQVTKLGPLDLRGINDFVSNFRGIELRVDEDIECGI